jgi:hypothetical protein
MDLINKSIPFLVSCSNGCAAKVEEQGNQRLPVARIIGTENN